MFENLRDAFRDAIANFKDEMARDQVPGSVDRLLSGMRDEVTDAKAAIHDLEAEIERTTSEAERADKEALTCRRREGMADEIGDEETARVAREFAEKYEKRHALMDQKAVALRQELEFRKGEIEEMLAKVKEAQAKRDSLAATAGRTGARASMQAADDLFSELDRMASKIQDEDARAEAAVSFDDIELEGDDFESPAPEAEEIDFDARLAELKRRMNER